MKPPTSSGRLVKRRPKVGDVIRFTLPYGSALAIVLERLDGGASRVLDCRDGPAVVTRHIEDERVVFINGRLTGNRSDDDD